jgi:hypothetical protein
MSERKQANGQASVAINSKSGAENEMNGHEGKTRQKY